MPSRPKNLVAVMTPVLIGVAVPLSQIGYAVTAGALAAACGLILLREDRMARLRDLAAAARSPLGLMIALVFLCWLPAVPGSIDPAKSAEVWARTLAYLALGNIVWSYLRAEPAGAWLCVRALSVAALLTVILAAANFLGATELISAIRLKGWTEGQAEQNMKYYASAAACLMPVLLLTGARLGGRWRIAGGIAAAGLLVFVVLTESGSALVGVAAAAALVGVAVAVRGSAPAMAAAWLLTLAGIILVLGWIGLHDIADYGDAAAYPLDLGLIDPHRQAIWNFALAQVPDAPWFGHGIDTANKLPGAATVVINPFEASQEFIASHPHSWMVEILLETGIVGFAAMLGAVAYGFIRIFRRAATPPDWPRQLALCGLFAAYFISGLSNFSFWASWWQISFITLWAIVCALPAQRPAAAAGAAARAAPPPERSPGR